MDPDESWQDGNISGGTGGRWDRSRNWSRNRWEWRNWRALGYQRITAEQGPRYRIAGEENVSIL